MLSWYVELLYMFLNDTLTSLEERGLLIPHVKACLNFFNIFLFSNKMEEIISVFYPGQFGL